MAEQKTEKNLRDLLSAFKESLQFWQVSISTPEKISQIESTNVKDLISEFKKVSKLIHAHITKLGIIFKPPIEIRPAYNTLKEASEKFVLLVSLVGQLKSNEFSEIYVNEIAFTIKKILSVSEEFVDEVSNLDFQKEESEQNNDLEVNGRLVSVGKVWEDCDKLEKLCDLGKIGFLNNKIRDSISLMDDGLEEIEEWVENPHDFDNDDPFGIDAEEPPTSSAESIDNEVKEEVIEFAKKWIQKIKMIKLLLKSLLKSIPKTDKTTGSKLDSIFSYQKSFVINIDELIVTLMMNNSIEDCKEFTILIIEDCKELIKVVKDLNNAEETKIKWCNVWLNKFLENL